MLQRREKGLIEQIQRPALLIRLISQLPGVNYHTHTSRCCSTYIIITVAKIENNLKLMIWSLPLSTSHTHAHVYMNTHTHTCSLHNNIPINIFCLNLPVYSQIPLPFPGASCFWDWFHLFNDGCANDPSYMADGVIDTTTSTGLRIGWGPGEWGVGDIEEGRLKWGKATEGRGKLETPCTQAVFVFLKQTRTLDTEWKLITTPWSNFYTVAQMKETYPPLIRDGWLVSMTLVDICFLKRLCGSFGESPWYIQMAFFAITIVLGTKKTSHFFKGVRSKWKCPSGHHKESKENNVYRAARMSWF